MSLLNLPLLFPTILIIRPSVPQITVAILASMHVEPSLRCREAVTDSWGWRGAGHRGGKVCPGLIDGVVCVQVVNEACARQAGYGVSVGDVMVTCSLGPRLPPCHA